ncbi:N,N-dimethylformamidase beta subunit family domain-containing protein [Litoreibacter roseus]|uniref:N,N-dimethylformamidase n=1 Tax=Litoreibacter roseus TaxID=2601869 RepID=A0A6N6JFD6_9RHOB|nr:N,N-dimethylformamidase beta subunit family domain-containing protein [Litoreibacter roseus]GFE64667.1 N,N-dimethylformamidase [Litoreibacter roseus]
MSGQKENPPLLGYCEQMSARPGETLEFKVSSSVKSPVTARLVRSISADPNPDGPGIVEEDASAFFEPTSFPSTHQPFFPGSYAVASQAISVAGRHDITLSAVVFPTLRSDRPQTVLSIGNLDLQIDTDGALALGAGDQVTTSGQPLKLRQWVMLEATLGANRLLLRHVPIGRTSGPAVETTHDIQSDLTTLGRPVVAAKMLSDGAATQHFSGKIEAPSVSVDGTCVAEWDFSKEISTTTVAAQTGPELQLVNFPTRAMTSSAWDGSEMNWTHKPAHYAAIHFHEDDIYDFKWQTSFDFAVPDDMPSGVYIMRLEADGHEDAIPFFVCPKLGRPTAKLCVLVSTFTYAVYGNHARPDYDPSWQDRMDEWQAYPHNPVDHQNYGLSTYNYHSDGSGICHASHRRPLFNLRPGFLTFGATSCSGLRHFQADGHLISWLHAKGIDYDLVTDMDLHRDGFGAIKGYRAVTTATHPEYHTKNSLDALRNYRDGGGHLLYLGANGFYWRIAIHEENDSLLEIRRAEDGIRAWAAEPGEYYNAFDGTYGGLWRRNARPPQDLVGIGFAAQGDFTGDPYVRTCRDPAYDWIFDGIEDDVIGDFGFSGGGAAGFELDHIDGHLGTPDSAVLLARSVTRDEDFMLVPEEQLTHLTNLSGGPEADALHADMIHFDVPGGGSVFATGSITFCGCLPWNNFENNVSQLLQNVMRRKLSDPH